MDKNQKETPSPTLPTKKNSKCNFMAILLSLLTLIILCLIAGIIVLAVKLHKKKDDYDELEEKYVKLRNEYNMTDSTFSKHNDSLNDIFDVYQKLIQETEIINPKISKDNYINVAEKVGSSNNLPDGTYDFVTKKEITYKNGYQVSFETDSRNYESGYYSNEEYDNLVYKLACLLKVNTSLGVYETIPEISYYIQNKTKALAIAALYNQISIWDWENDFEVLNDFHQDKYF